MRSAHRSQVEPLRGLRFQFRRQSPQDFVDDCARRTLDIDDNRVLLRGWLLQVANWSSSNATGMKWALSRRRAPADLPETLMTTRTLGWTMGRL